MVVLILSIQKLKANTYIDWNQLFFFKLIINPLVHEVKNSGKSSMIFIKFLLVTMSKSLMTESKFELGKS